MKRLALLLCIITLAGCSLTTQPNEPITNSGSTISGTIINKTSTGVDLMSGEDLTLSGSIIVTGSTSGDIADGVAHIQDNNIWVKSGTQLIQLTKNGGRTDLCDNGEPLEYLDPQINGDYLLMIVNCKDESSEIYVKDIHYGTTKKVGEDIISSWSKPQQLEPSYIQGSDKKRYNNPLEPAIIQIIGNELDGGKCYTDNEILEIKRIVRSSIKREEINDKYCKQIQERDKKTNNRSADYRASANIEIRGYSNGNTIISINCLSEYGHTPPIQNILYIKNNKLIDPNIMSNTIGTCVKDNVIIGLNSSYYNNNTYKFEKQEVVAFNIVSDTKFVHNISQGKSTLLPGVFGIEMRIKHSGSNIIIDQYDENANITNNDYNIETIILPLK